MNLHIRSGEHFLYGIILSLPAALQANYSSASMHNLETKSLINPSYWGPLYVLCMHKEVFFVALLCFPFPTQMSKHFLFFLIPNLISDGCSFVLETGPVT